MVTLKKSGTYTVSGNIGSYRIAVHTRSLRIKLILKNVICSNTTTSCIYNSRKSTRLTIQTAKGSSNRFAGPSDFVLKKGHSTPNAVIFSDGNLTLNGSGSLTVKDNSENGDAISGKRNISLSSGSVSAFSKSAVLHADNINVNGGSLIATSYDTAVKASKVVTINDGNLQISAVDKGIQGKAGVVIKKGTINVRTTKSTNPKFGDFRGITAGVAGKNGNKAVAGSILVTGGDITINSYGDCIHAANNVTISGGTFKLVSTADDGIQAKATLTITGSPKLSIQAEGKKTKGTINNIAASVKY